MNGRDFLTEGIRGARRWRETIEIPLEHGVEQLPACHVLGAGLGVNDGALEREVLACVGGDGEGSVRGVVEGEVPLQRRGEDDAGALGGEGW